MVPLKPNHLLPIDDPTGNEQVCYFLGAGFSKDSRYELPTALGFLSPDAPIFCRESSNEKLKTTVNKHSELAPLFARLEKTFGDLSQRNLEDIMTDLHVRTAGIGRPWTVRDPATIDSLARLPQELGPGEFVRTNANEPPTDFSRDYALLLLYICLRLRVIELDAQPCERTQRLVASLRRRDSIVTLNYDTVVERHLAYQHAGRWFRGDRVRRLDIQIGPAGAMHHGGGMPIYVRIQPLELGYFAKLHGSVDWRSCSSADCVNYRYINAVDRVDDEPFNGAELINCGACGAPLDTVIIPPVATKSFARFPKLGLMWLQAYRALRLAHRWVFIGVSLAPTDMHLRSLLRAASEEWAGADIPGKGQICVVNKDDDACEEVAGNLWACLSPRVQQALNAPDAGIATFTSISDYLTEVERIDVKRV